MLLFVPEHLLIEREALVMERVAELLALGGQVCLVVRVGDVLDRQLVCDRQPITGQPGDLLRVVGEDADRGQAEVDEDLGANPVVAQVGRQAQAEIGVDRVEPLLLELVRPQLVQEPDPSTLLA